MKEERSEKIKRTMKRLHKQFPKGTELQIEVYSSGGVAEPLGGKEVEGVLNPNYAKEYELDMGDGLYVTIVEASK